MANTRKRQTAALKVKAPGAKQSIDNMKYEIANEFGVNLGPNASSRDNGIVGGEITKRLIEKSKQGSQIHTKRSKKRGRKANKA